MASFSPHMDILPPAQQMLWPNLGDVGALGYVLYGGTAIALRLGHRASVDFDFFSDRPLDKPTLQASLPFVAGATVLQDSVNTFTILTPAMANLNTSSSQDQVKISFFGGIGFGRIGVPDSAANGVYIASLDDLMATKLKVLVQRVEAKDYLDIVALIVAGVALDRGLAGARLLFGPAFQPSECLKALVYFQGGDLDSLSTDIQRTLIDAVSGVGSLPTISLAAHSLA